MAPPTRLTRSSRIRARRSGGNTGILGLNIFNYGQLFTQPTVGYDEYFLASNNSRQFSDNVNWIRGRHTMTFGFNYLRKGEEDFDSVRYVAYGCAPAPGAYCGNGPQLFTANQGVGGDAFAEVLLGLPSVIHQRFSYTSGGPFAPEPNVVIPYYGSLLQRQVEGHAEADGLLRTPLRTAHSYLRHQQHLLCASTSRPRILSPYPESLPACRSTMPRLPSTTSLPDSAWRGRFAPSSSSARDTAFTTTPARARYRMLLTGAFYGGVPGGFVGDEIDNSTPQEAQPLLKCFSRRRKWLWEPSPSLPARGRAITEPVLIKPLFYADRNNRFARLTSTVTCLISSRRSPTIL